MMSNCGSGPFSQHRGHEGCDPGGHDSKDKSQPIVLDTDSEEVDSYAEDSSDSAVRASPIPREQEDLDSDKITCLRFAFKSRCSKVDVKPSGSSTDVPLPPTSPAPASINPDENVDPGAYRGSGSLHTPVTQ
jgi:hypothetical protein